MNEVRYAASVMCANFARLEEDLKALEAAGCHELHFDLMDGLFVPNITLGFDYIQTCWKVCKTPCAAHLMITQSQRFIPQAVATGSSVVTVHVESCLHPHRALTQIRELGASPGIALNPATPLSSLDYLLDYVDRVLVMTVDPGYAGQTILPESFRRVERVKQTLVSRRLTAKIEVDGNINLANAKRLVAGGADILVLGTSSIFNQPQPLAESLREFHQRLHSSQ